MKDWRNRTRWLSIALEDCDLDDRTYFIPCFADLGPLKESVLKVGIIHRPLVQQSAQGRWIPVLGRRRLLAARQIGLAHVGADTLEDSVSQAVAFEVAFWDNVSHRQFEGPTKAVVVYRLLQLFPREEVAERFLPVLGVPPHGPRIEALCRVATLEPEIHLLMALGRLNEKTALLLSYLTPSDREVVLALINRLNPNMNKSADIIGALFDLAAHQACSVQEVLNNQELQEILCVPETKDASSILDAMRSVLRRLRHPELTEKEAQFAEWLKAQRLPSDVTIRPSQAFEDESCVVEIKVATRQEATNLVQRIISIEGTH